MALSAITPLMPMGFRTTLVPAPMIPIPTLDSTIANGHRGGGLFRCHLHTTFCVLYTFVVIISPSLLLVPSRVFGCSVKSRFPLHDVSISLYAISATDRWLVFRVLPQSIGGRVYGCCWSGVRKDRDGGIQFAPDEEDCFPECSHPEVGQHPRHSSIEHRLMSVFTGCNISMGFVLHYQDSRRSHEVRILKFHILRFR